ncbi:ABC transporter permease [Halapricum desulfuricans]|uniref:ABC-type Fe3+ transport system, permease component n=1 Tax=Halapricum desulfuricans TaxID=2841257 RepID=A0A897N620_9EURY|nr:iron ABC transporter permease [Halapricum desulfuricans]QSG06509.1 ABC-type Fe3+ transport system, permease component [Halapricum desulfuricans]
MTADRTVSRALQRAALPVGVAATIAVLLVVFYYPVGNVLASAVRDGGHFTSAPIRAVLTDPFYTGVAHHLFADPLGVPAGVVDWTGAGFPSVRLGLFGFTAYQALLSTVASVLLGLPGAYVLARYDFRGRRTITSLTLVPFVLPSILVAVGFRAMFSRRGVANDLLGAVGLGPVELLGTLQIVVLAHAFYNAPLVTRLVTTAWEGVDRRQVESARSLGASRIRAFSDVVLPALAPAILTGAVLTFVFTFMSFPIVLTLGGLDLATVEVWIYARVQSLALREAATLATLETVLSLAFIYVYLRYENRQVTTRRGGQSLPRERLVAGWRSLFDPRRLAIAGYVAIVAVVIVGPLVSLLVESVTDPSGSFTTAYYEFLLARQSSGAVGTVRPLPAVINSLVFGAGTLLLAIPMGVVVAVAATRGGRGSRIAEAILTAPLAVSGIVVGIGLLLTFVFGTTVAGHRLVVTGPVAIVFAHAAAAYPFVTRNVAPALGGLDPRLREVARSLGATRLRALLEVELPVIAPALLAGAAFAFAISIGEFDSTVLLAEGVDSYTMPVALERYIGTRSLGPNLGPATAMGTVLLAVTAVSFVVIDRLGGRWEP